MIGKSLRPVLRCFLAGVFAVLPLVVTVVVVMWVVGFLGELLGPEAALGQPLKQFGLQFTGSSIVAYLIGWVLVLSAIFALGMAVELGARRLFQRTVDSLAARVPLLGGVYGTVRQLVNMMDKTDDANLKEMSVVFCVFGKETGAAFLALLPTPERFRVGDVDYHAVIIPSAPVPVGGSLIFVPADSVRPSDLSVDAFMSVYVSMGVTGPQHLPTAQV